MIPTALGLVQQGGPGQRGVNWAQVHLDVAEGSCLQRAAVVATHLAYPRVDLAAKPSYQSF